MKSILTPKGLKQYSMLLVIPRLYSQIYVSMFILCRIQCLRHLKDFFTVMFKFDSEKVEDRDGEEEKEGSRIGGDKITITCVGAGYRNLGKTVL